MKNRLPILFLLAAPSCISFGQAPGPPEAEAFQFHTPEEWRGEIIQLPPGFASDLGWNGVESIKFAPGMFQADSDSFFSYVLVFLLAKDADVSEKGVQAEVLKYYRGLATAVMGGKGIEVDTEKFALKLEPIEITKPPRDVPADAGDGEVKIWNATLDWTEPFATQKKQTLNFEIHLWKNDGRPVLYFTVSPQERDHEIWKEMRGYRAKFKVGG
ncbi:MAG: hypothetical protein HKN23_19765 [Verrucomicrobiales bacterium]|nr:hypothetical protein [Verrucomicrobiales bacterium]